MIALLLSAALVPAADAEPVVTPKGTPPTVLVGQMDKAGNFVSQVTVQQVIPVTTKETAIVDGKPVTRDVLTYQTVMKTVQVTRDLSKATAMTASGKKLDRKALADRLGKATGVVFSSDGKPVDKGFLAMFKADTVVIVAPVAAPGVGTITPPPPPPVAPRPAR